MKLIRANLARTWSYLAHLTCLLTAARQLTDVHWAHPVFAPFCHTTISALCVAMHLKFVLLPFCSTPQVCRRRFSAFSHLGSTPLLHHRQHPVKRPCLHRVFLQILTLVPSTNPARRSLPFWSVLLSQSWYLILTKARSMDRRKPVTYSNVFWLAPKVNPIVRASSREA